MALLSNINDKFAVDSTGAIQFNGQVGTSGYVLKSNANAAPTWVDPLTIIGGPYLPLTGGTLTGALAGTSATFAGDTQAQKIISTKGFFATGNIVTPASGTSALIMDYYLGNSRFWSRGADATTKGVFQFIQLENDGGGQVTSLTIDSSGNSTFKGNVVLNGDGNALKWTPTSYDDWTMTTDSNGLVIYNITDARYDLKISGDGNATFAGNVISLDTFYLQNSSGNRWQMLFDTNDFNLRYYNGTSWSADALAIDTSNNATFAGNVTINGTATIGGNDVITRSGITAQSRLAIWQNDTAIKGDSNLFYASQFLTIGSGTAGGFAALRINADPIGQTYLDFTEGATFTKRARIQVDTNSNMYFRNTSNSTERMRIDSSGNIFIKKNLEIGEASNTTSASNNYIPIKINTTYSTTASPQWSLQGWVATTDGADPFAMTSGETTKNVYMGIIGAQYMNQNRFSIVQGGQERLTVNLTQTGNGSVSGNVGIGTTLPTQPLDVNGYSICNKQFQRDNTLLTILNTPRVLNIGYRGANGTYTFDPTTLFGSLAQGGQCVLQVTGWRAALNNGIINWADNGSNTNIGAGHVYYTQTAYRLGGQNGSNLISVSNTSGTNNITITFTGWHSNSHGWNCKIISYQA